MGGNSTKLRKYLVRGDEVKALQVGRERFCQRDCLLQFCQRYGDDTTHKRAFDVNASYGGEYDENTPLHYACQHAMLPLIRFDSLSTPSSMGVQDLPARLTRRCEQTECARTDMSAFIVSTSTACSIR
jgi:hypothetical protein